MEMRKFLFTRMFTDSTGTYKPVDKVFFLSKILRSTEKRYLKDTIVSYVLIKQKFAGNCLHINHILKVQFSEDY